MSRDVATVEGVRTLPLRGNFIFPSKNRFLLKKKSQDQEIKFYTSSPPVKKNCICTPPPIRKSLSHATPLPLFSLRYIPEYDGEGEGNGIHISNRRDLFIQP